MRSVSIGGVGVEDFGKQANSVIGIGIDKIADWE
jgi:hypothetical protein